MDNLEARALLAAELITWRTKSYAELSAVVGESHHIDRVGSSGVQYQVEVEVMWDDKPRQNIRVIGSIDDGGWRAFSPLTDSFVLSPTGDLVSEKSDA